MKYIWTFFYLLYITRSLVSQNSKNCRHFPGCRQIFICKCFSTHDRKDACILHRTNFKYRYRKHYLEIEQSEIWLTTAQTVLHNWVTHQCNIHATFTMCNHTGSVPVYVYMHGLVFMRPCNDACVAFKSATFVALTFLLYSQRPWISITKKDIVGVDGTMMCWDSIALMYRSIKPEIYTEDRTGLL
jgi:hypothetical protein